MSTTTPRAEECRKYRALRTAVRSLTGRREEERRREVSAQTFGVRWEHDHQGHRARWARFSPNYGDGPILWADAEDAARRSDMFDAAAERVAREDGWPIVTGYTAAELRQLLACQDANRAAERAERVTNQHDRKPY